MKKVLLAIALILCAIATGNAQTIRNTSNSAIATIDDKGNVRNTSNSVIAKIDSKGVIRDKSNRMLGKIESDGRIRDKNNSCVGKIESDGKVRDCQIKAKKAGTVTLLYNGQQKTVKLKAGQTQNVKTW